MVSKIKVLAALLTRARWWAHFNNDDKTDSNEEISEKREKRRDIREELTHS